MHAEKVWTPSHTKNQHLHLFFFYGSFPLFDLPQTLKFASDHMEWLLVKGWKIYHVNGARTPEPNSVEKAIRRK